MVKTEFKDREKFNELLILKGYSLKTFSDFSGVGYDTISQITRGLRTPAPRVAFKICKALGMEFDDLFKFKHPMRGDY